MPINSKRKGKRGELLLASLFRDHGYDAKRGVQYQGGAESPDVVVEGVSSWLHIECKIGNCNMTDAMTQASADANGKHYAVFHKPNHKPWRITMPAETFFAFLRGDLPHGEAIARNKQVSDAPDSSAPKRESTL